MKILAGLIRLFETSSASDSAICEAYTHNSQLQLEASDLGHCAVYEKELQRLWPITEENRKGKIAEFGEKHGFRLAYYKQGHCAIFVEDSIGHDIRTRENRRAAIQIGIKAISLSPRKYQVLGIINDERLQAPFEMGRYYHDVAAKVKQAGGNGAIEVYSNSQIAAIVSNSSTTSSGTVSAYGAGNVAFGQYSGSSNTTGWTAAQQHHSARFIVVKYL